MSEQEKIRSLRDRMADNLCTCILPFWQNRLKDTVNGGFYGKVNADMSPDLSSPKCVVLNTRLLWAYTMAGRVLKDETSAALAHRAFTYIKDYFWDPVYGGVYWSLTAKGEPGEIEKRTYGQAFLIYSMAEYYRVYRDEEALALAMETWRLTRRHLLLPEGGYADSATRDWLPDDWVNVWIKNRGGAARLLNSNMHLFEAILALAKVTNDPEVREALREQLEFLLDTAMDWDHRSLKAGMDLRGNRLDHEINFGHDCECSYLMTEAAEYLGDRELQEKASRAALALVENAYRNGLDPVNKGMYYLSDYETGKANRCKIWWVEAEGVTAFFNAYQMTREERYLDAAVSIWDYIEHCMADEQKGEWIAVGDDPCTDPELEAQKDALLTVFNNDEMAGKGKCPYHNSRACYEILTRASSMLGD